MEYLELSKKVWDWSGTTNIPTCSFSEVGRVQTNQGWLQNRSSDAKCSCAKSLEADSCKKLIV